MFDLLFHDLQMKIYFPCRYKPEVGDIIVGRVIEVLLLYDKSIYTFLFAIT